jgi:hypothetical protein
MVTAWVRHGMCESALNVFETGITLPGRSEVSLAATAAVHSVIDTCFMHKLTLFGISRNLALFVNLGR